MKATEEKPMIFWNDDFQGEVQGGYFVRNNLKEFIQKLEESGKKIAAIKFDGSYNLEILVEKEIKKETEF